MNPYEELANAIIIQACQDYLSQETMRGDCLHFFRSRWFTALTTIDPEYLIKCLKKRRIRKS